MRVVKLHELRTEICNQTGFRSEDVDAVLDSLFPLMLDALSRGDDIMIKRFGRFSLRKSSPHVCTDARTGKKTMSSYKATIKFKQSKMIGEQLAILTNPEYDWGDDEE